MTIGSKALNQIPSGFVRQHSTEKVSQPPVSLVTTVEESAQGPIHTVRWTDTSRFQFHDPGLMRYALVLFAFILFVFSMSAGPRGSELGSLAWIVAFGAAGYWIYRYRYQQYRHSQRGLSFMSDGSIKFLNPPSYQLDRYATEPDFIVPGALSRITSIEYTKTEDWLPIDEKYVFGRVHWYEVHMFLGGDWRISIARNYGRKDHVHQLTTHLNKLKEQLTLGEKALPRSNDQKEIG